MPSPPPLCHPCMLVPAAPLLLGQSLARVSLPVPEKLRAVRRLLAVEPLPLADDVEVGELAEVGVGLPAQPGGLAGRPT